MEVEAAARRLFLQDGTLQGYVAGKVFKHRLQEAIDGTGGRAIVTARSGGWATPDPVKSVEYPILTVKFYADPDRDGDGLMLQANAEDKAMAMYRSADRLLHGRRGFRMGAMGSDPGLMVVTCQRWKEPVTQTEKDRHGEGSGDPLGDTVYVYVEYALQVVH